MNDRFPCAFMPPTVDRYPRVQAVQRNDGRSVVLYKEVSEGYFEVASPEPQVLAVVEGAEPPIWQVLTASDAVGIRDALVALLVAQEEAPSPEPSSEPIAVDERDKYLSIIELQAEALARRGAA